MVALPPVSAGSIGMAEDCGCICSAGVCAGGDVYTGAGVGSGADGDAGPGPGADGDAGAGVGADGDAGAGAGADGNAGAGGNADVGAGAGAGTSESASVAPDGGEVVMVVLVEKDIAVAVGTAVLGAIIGAGWATGEGGRGGGAKLIKGILIFCPVSVFLTAFFLLSGLVETS